MIVPIIQARLGGRRFPGKVLARIADKRMLTRVCEAAVAAFGSRVYVACPTGQDDSELNWWVTPDCFFVAGDEADVLARFVLVADTLKLSDDDIIIRLTADDPFKHPPLLRETARLCTPETPYVNSNHGQVEGVGCEAFTVKLLREAHTRREPDEIEHVTPGMARRYPSPKVSLTVDTPEDLARFA